MRKLYTYILICLLMIISSISYADKVIYLIADGNIINYETDYAYIPVNDQNNDPYFSDIIEINGSYGTYVYDWSLYGFGYISNKWANPPVNTILITNIAQATYFKQIVISNQVNWSDLKYYPLSNPSNFVNSNIIVGLVNTNWVQSRGYLTNMSQAVFASLTSVNFTVQNQLNFVPTNTIATSSELMKFYAVPTNPYPNFLLTADGTWGFGNGDAPLDIWMGRLNGNSPRLIFSGTFNTSRGFESVEYMANIIVTGGSLANQVLKLSTNGDITARNIYGSNFFGNAAGLTNLTETDPKWTAASNLYATTNYVDNKFYPISNPSGYINNANFNESTTNNVSIDNGNLTVTFKTYAPGLSPTNPLLTWSRPLSIESQVAYWPLNWLTAMDHSSYTNKGTISAITLIDGKYHNAYKFNNTSYVNINDDLSIDIGTNNFTLSCWTYGITNSVYGNSAIIMKKTNTIGMGYGIAYSNSASTSFMKFYYATTNIDLSVPANWVQSNWIHWVMTRNSSNLNIYANGELALNSISSVYTNNISNTAILRFGTNVGFNGYSGVLDDVRIFQRTLSDLEVISLYSQPAEYYGNANHSEFYQFEPLTTAPVPARKGMIFYNNTSGRMQWYNGSSWGNL